MRTSALVMAAALVAPPTPSPDRPHEAPAQKRAEPGGRVHSEGGSRTTLLIAGGAVVAFAGGLGIGSLRRRAPRRRTAGPGGGGGRGAGARRGGRGGGGGGGRGRGRRGRRTPRRIRPSRRHLRRTPRRR